MLLHYVVMSSEMVIATTIGVVVVLGGIAMFTLARRSDVRGAGALSNETVVRDRNSRASRVGHDAFVRADRVEAEGAAAGTRPPATEAAEVGQSEIVAWTPPDPEVVAVSRRQFFNRASVTLMGVGTGAFVAAAFLAFLWPTRAGGFGGEINAGKLADVKDGIKQGNGFFYVPAARSWITEYPAESLPLADNVYSESVVATMRLGITVMSQKCPHLGCRVPECPTSQWFECQCHGSQYNRVGEKKAGPAPRGLDRFPVTLTPADDVVIDTGTVVPGPPIGTNTTGQEAEGPHCTNFADSH